MSAPDREPGHTIVGLGEVLWDLFEDDERRLGGAPTNVAFHATVLGDRGAVASRVGDDALGREARRRLEERGLDLGAMQIDPQLPTGTATVQLSAGQPSFNIDSRGAWTAMEWTPQLEVLLERADLVCFGSLMLAFPGGRALLRRARQAAPLATWLLDLNLRSPFDTAEAMDAALAAADIVKLSEEEEDTVARHLGVSEGARWLVDARGMAAVTVTRGARGSLLVTPEGTVEHPGHPCGGEGDTVGAGDAFTAVLAHHLVRGHALSAAQAAANSYASFVASCSGAMPEPTDVVRTNAIMLNE